MYAQWAMEAREAARRRLRNGFETDVGQVHHCRKKSK
jgi:hypothetical protein